MKTTQYQLRISGRVPRTSNGEAMNPTLSLATTIQTDRRAAADKYHLMETLRGRLAAGR